MAAYKCTAVCWLCPQEIEHGTPRKYCADCATVVAKQQRRLSAERTCRECGGPPKSHSPFCAPCSIQRLRERWRRKHEACRAERPGREPHPCAVCGVVTAKPMYCSNSCKVRGHRIRSPEKYAAYLKRDAVRRSIASASTIQVRREIADLHWIARAVRRAQRLTTKPAKCRHCESEFRRVRKYMRFCSKQCREEAKAITRRIARKRPSHRKHKSSYKARRSGLFFEPRPLPMQQSRPAKPLSCRCIVYRRSVCSPSNALRRGREG